MTAKEAVASALQVFTVLLFCVVSAFFFSLPFSDELRIALSDMLLFKPDLCTQIAIGFSCITALLLFGFYGINRGYYLVFRMGKNTYAVDEKVVWQTVEPELRKKFAAQLTLSGIEIARGKQIGFSLEASKMSEQELEELLALAESHLETILKERFGYKRTFTVRVFPRATE